MGGDLGASTSEVHVAAERVLDFWFDELDPEKHFAKDDALDREIADRFGDLRDRVLATRAKRWQDGPAPLLAAIILLDQFSRNIHRDTPGAFEADGLAQELALLAIDQGWDRDLPNKPRQFLYMPLMHAEDAALQQLSIEKFGELNDAEVLKFAEAHKAVIDRFGRFPSRNAALGRPSTAEERDYLSQPGAGW